MAQGRSSPCSTPASTTTAAISRSRTARGRRSTPGRRRRPGVDEHRSVAPQDHRVRLPLLLRSVPEREGLRESERAERVRQHRHGTHAAGDAVGRHRRTRSSTISRTRIAPGAKLIVQDGGFIGGDFCSQRPGFGCPVNLTPILDQAYKQGARIHSNSWGDRQNTPPPLPTPTANYSQSARDVDAFVYAHPDMLVVFDTGNCGRPPKSPNPPPAMSLAAPGDAKNTLQVGGVRPPGRGDDADLVTTRCSGPTRDGRIKPDVVGPSTVLAGDWDYRLERAQLQRQHPRPGTSWSTPTIAGARGAGAAVLHRWLLSRAARASDRRDHAERRAAQGDDHRRGAAVPWRMTLPVDVPAKPVPSIRAGLRLPRPRRRAVFPRRPRQAARRRRAAANGLASGESATLQSATPSPARRSRPCWCGPIRRASCAASTDSTPELVNDLDLA